uniref:Bridging integrator 3 homolog n=1 Tax=Phallusia mammillata TaxID=59560 RepID=A0A6F9D835_9ASCI|nr:bridging integrator 3 homolog [Phallusia mammillata]
MSWNFFNRTSKRSVVTKAAERDYERECTKMQHLEDASKKIYKDSKKATAANEAFGKASAKIGQDLITTLGGQVSPPLKAFEIATTKQKQLLQERASLTNQCWTESTKKYNSIFPYYSTQLKTRDKALQEYSKVQAKLDKYQEREHTAANSVKIEQAKREMLPVKADFEQKNSTLMSDMPKFYAARLDYFQPALKASVQSECWVHREVIRTFKNSLNVMDTEAGSKADGKVRNLLEDIRKLSITTDD